MLSLRFSHFQEDPSCWHQQIDYEFQAPKRVTKVTYGFQTKENHLGYYSKCLCLAPNMYKMDVFVPIVRKL